MIATNEEWLERVLDICTERTDTPVLPAALKARIVKAWLASIDKAIQVGAVYYDHAHADWEALELTPLRAAEQNARETVQL